MYTDKSIAFTFAEKKTARKYARVFVLGHYLVLEAHSFPRAALSETVRFSESIMSAHKHPSIFSHQMEAIVYVQHERTAQWSHAIKDKIKHHAVDKAKKLWYYRR